MSESAPECERLAARLRVLRDRRRLTLTALAERTAYSRSSWQRWLAGRSVPPWAAVSALCRLAGEPEPGVRALWELAEAAGRARTAIRARPAEPAPQRAAGADGAAGHPAVLPGAPEPRAVQPEAAEHPASPRTADHDRPPHGGTDHDRPPHSATARDRTSYTATAPDQAPHPTADPGTSPHTTSNPLTPSPHPHRKLLLATAALTICVLLACAGTLLTGTPRLMPSSASAGFHVGCTGVACDGKDPGPVLCGVEPKTLLHVRTRTGIGLEIRYNPLCRAAWARVWDAPAGSALAFTVPGGPTERVTVAHSGTTDPFVYTGLAAVLDNGRAMKACVTPATGDPAACYAVAQP